MEITNRDDLRAGDVATFSYQGHDFTGEVWSQGGRAMIGKMPLGTVEEWDTGLTFVRATREMPPLPDEPGSVIETTAIDGNPIEPTLAMFDAGGVWMLAYQREEQWTLRSRQITEWRPMKVVPE